jgi:hypothetical protein
MQHAVYIGLVGLVRLTVLLTLAHVPYAFLDATNTSSVRWTVVVLCALVALFFVAATFVRSARMSKHVLMAILSVPVVGGMLFAASEGALNAPLLIILFLVGFHWLLLLDIVRSKAYELDMIWLLPAQTMISLSIAGFETFPLMAALAGTVVVAIAESNVLRMGAYFPAAYATALSAAAWVAPLFVIAVLPIPISTLSVFALFGCVVALALLFRRVRQQKPFGLKYTGNPMLVLGVPVLIASVLLLALVAEEYRVGYYAAFILTCAGALLVDGWVRGKLEGATAGAPETAE